GNVYVTEANDVTLRDLTHVSSVTNNAGAAKEFNVQVASSGTGNLTVASAVASGSTANVVLEANSVVVSANVGDPGNTFSYLRATSGNITTTGTGNVVLGGNVTLKAQTDVGTAAARIQTSATNLAVNSATGNVYVTEANDVTLRDLTHVSSVTNN